MVKTRNTAAPDSGVTTLCGSIVTRSQELDIGKHLGCYRKVRFYLELRLLGSLQWGRDRLSDVRKNLDFRTIQFSGTIAIRCRTIRASAMVPLTMILAKSVHLTAPFPSLPDRNAHNFGAYEK